MITKRQTIKIAVGPHGERAHKIPVEAEICGPLVVHDGSLGFTSVTHVVTGRMVESFLSRAMARRFANRLAEHPEMGFRTLREAQKLRATVQRLMAEALG